MIFNVLLVTIGVAVSVAASAPSPIHLQVVCTANVRIATNAGKQQQQPPCHCKVDGNFIFMVQLFSGSCIALLPRLQCSFKHTTGAGWRVRALITSRCINRLKLKICPPQTPPPQNKNKIKVKKLQAGPPKLHCSKRRTLLAGARSRSKPTRTLPTTAALRTQQALWRPPLLLALLTLVRVKM